MSNGDTAFQKVIICIPQVYFDIIGRVIPGTLIMGLAWIAVHGPKGFWKSLNDWLDGSKVTTIIVATVLFILTSYTLAILIWCVWSCVITKIFEDSKANEKIYWDNKEFRRKYEKLKYYNTAAGNRVTKLKAQIHMAETLFIGLPLSCSIGVITYLIEVITCFIGIVTYFWPFNIAKVEIPSLFPRFVSWVFILLADICSLFVRQYLILHMNNSLDNNLELLEQEEKKK